MTIEELANTTIGRDHLESNKHYPINHLLDYLNGLKAMRAAAQEKGDKTNVFEKEIIAVNFLLTRKMYY